MVTRGHARSSVFATVDGGAAELVPDPRRPAGWTVLVDDIAQSYVDLDEPTWLEFDYARRIAGVIGAVGPPPTPLRVLHLGGGGLTLARYVAASRPGSRQLVVERDAPLAALVRQVLPVPDGAGIEVLIDDARHALAGLAGQRFDLVVCDVFWSERIPRSVVSGEFAAEVAALLRPGGLYAMNVTDVPPLAFSRDEAATLRGAFADVCALTDVDAGADRRFVNVILVGAGPAGLPAGLRSGGPDLLYGKDLDEWTAGARSMTDATAKDSPPPRPRRR
ncbi:MAG: fused MFS/spermidine synthase [Actinocatenispora sp.]